MVEVSSISILQSGLLRQTAQEEPSMNFFTALLAQMPDAVAKGLIWGLMALGVYITYKILDFPDLTVDGSLCTGGAVAAVMIVSGIPAPTPITMAAIIMEITGCSLNRMIRANKRIIPTAAAIKSLVGSAAKTTSVMLPAPFPIHSIGCTSSKEF